MSYGHGMPEFVIFKEHVFIVQNLILQNGVTAQKLMWLLFNAQPIPFQARQSNFFQNLILFF